MKTWIDLPDRRKKDIIIQASNRRNLPEYAVEKDWWVSTILHALFSLPYAEGLVFKGGTSLSKGWNLISRFSEDIDLGLDRNLLGFSEELTNSQIEKLRKKAGIFVMTTVLPNLGAQLSKFGLNSSAYSLAIQPTTASNADPQIIECEYNSLFEQHSYIKNKVIIEFSARSLLEPSSKQKIQSFISEVFPNENFADTPFTVTATLPKKTFLEKMVLLHEEMTRPKEQIRFERKSRHFGDIESLMDTDHGMDAVKDNKLYNAILNHRKIFTPIKGIDYDSLKIGQLNFIPTDETKDAWKKDYLSMREMYFSNVLPFENLIERLQELKKRISTI